MAFITLAEALTLPTAQLSDEENRRAQVLLAQIEVEVRKNMRRSGVVCTVEEIDANVLFEVTRQIRMADPSWGVTLKPIQTVSRVTGKPSVTSFAVALTPQL